MEEKEEKNNKKILLEAIATSFNLDELHTFVYGLNINWDALAGDTISTKSLSLIDYACRHHLTDQLRNELINVRPQIDWISIDWPVFKDDVTYCQLFS